MVTVRKVVTTLAADADIRSVVRVGDDTYLVRRHDGTTFTFDVRSATFADDALAQHAVADPNATNAVDFHVTIADNASDSTVERALARHIAELAATGTATFTPAELGQVAEMRVLARWYGHRAAGTPLDLPHHNPDGEQDPQLRLVVRRQLTAIADPLGLRAGTPAAETRLAAMPPEVRGVLDDASRRGRFGRWAADLVISVAGGVTDAASRLSLHATQAGWTSVGPPSAVVSPDVRVDSIVQIDQET